MVLIDVPNERNEVLELLRVGGETSMTGETSNQTSDSRRFLTYTVRDTEVS